jgi:hypothetical protein
MLLLPPARLAWLGARSLAWGWDVLFKSRRAMPKGGS